ncbi:PH, RCC1 and FYVE domains-containing protein 1-like [Pyrus communis]|uniref:PH, RCC1 and FYVE domains-containing protein 1-like n=1 Tax=Pyrus communis TaxID=23211 RepID=UPI0035C13413
MCYGCRLPFNFKRKRHSCDNCGLALWHSCSSEKCLKASTAPNPNKPYRVCDNCFAKLRKATETNSSSGSASSRRASMNQGFNELIENNFKEMESESSKRNKKMDFSSNRVVPIANGVSESRAPNGTKSFNPVFRSSKKFFSALSGFTLPKVACLSRREEVLKLKAQVEDLTRKAQLREIEMEKTAQQLKEALKVAGEETVKCKAAKEVIKSLTAQKAKRRVWYLKASPKKKGKISLPIGTAIVSSSEKISDVPRATSNHTEVAHSEATARHKNRGTKTVTAEWIEQDEPGVYITLVSLPGGVNDLKRVRFSRRRFNEKQAEQWWAANRGRVYQQYNVPVVKKSGGAKAETAQGDEWVEQDEPGVYITLASLPGGVKDLKHVRFSRKRFSEKQAEQWWAANRGRVYQQYHVRAVQKSQYSDEERRVSSLSC